MHQCLALDLLGCVGVGRTGHTGWQHTASQPVAQPSMAQQLSEAQIFDCCACRNFAAKVTARIAAGDRLEVVIAAARAVWWHEVNMHSLHRPNGLIYNAHNRFTA